MKLIYSPAENMRNFSLKVSKLRRISQVEKTITLPQFPRILLQLLKKAFSSLPLVHWLFPPYEGQILICNVLEDKLIRFS